MREINKEPAPPGNINMGKILVVNENFEVADVISDCLNLAGQRVLVATDGASALENLDRFGVDLIVLSRHLPDTDGYEMCRKLRAASHNTPIVVLSETCQADDRIDALEAGADDCVDNPVNMVELLARIRALLLRFGVRMPLTPGSPHYALNN